ncbi:MAG: biosynthetic arginine decarboxylase [Thiotrichales bacterium]
MNDWTIDDARDLYHLRGWGADYFDINAQGHVVMKAGVDDPARGIDLKALTQRLLSEGLDLPVLVRFEDILNERIDRLSDAFEAARAAHGYAGGYTAIYPIKVNQQRSVVDEIIDHGGARVGLEAGSKPELLAVLARSRPGGAIVCNGYKDRDFIRLAMIGQLMGHRVYIVIEKLTELAHVFAVADELGIEPKLGVRVRLASLAKGNWQNTGGEKGKFGLTAAQVLSLIEQLRQRNALHWLKLLHFHMGSQLSDLADIRRGVTEAATYLGELNRLGVDIRVFDTGGGLGVDYEGLHSEHACSINYDLRGYAGAIVEILQRACEAHGLEPLEVFTEAGRAMTAHHAVLITEVVDNERIALHGKPGGPFADLYDCINTDNPVALLHEAEQRLQRYQAGFNAGRERLEARAGWEQSYFSLCRCILDHLGNDQDELRVALQEKLADKTFLNFSLFQSIPDAWALKQIFPVLPLQRLDERPTRAAVLQDLTCDSDGRIGVYSHGGSIQRTLPLHVIEPGEHYLIGIFLVGAYQEILGDMHNLFGDTHSINVRRTDDGGYALHEEELGDTVNELLDYVHFDTYRLTNECRKKIAHAGLPETTRRLLDGTLSAALSGYSYLNHLREV